MALKESIMNDISGNTLRAIIAAQVRLVSLGNDLSAVMDAASSTAAELTGADGAVVELLEGEDIVYRSACGLAEPQLGLHMPVANSLSGFCLSNQTSAICNDSETDTRVNREACRKVGLRAMIIVPLIADKQAIAVMKLVWTTPRSFEDGEAEIAQLLANMAAVLMHRAAEEGPAILRQRLTLDEETGTPNRSFFHEQLQTKVAAASKDGGQMAIAMFRIEGLDSLRETAGKKMSAILLEISRRMERECRVGDIVARTGTYEFSVMLGMAGRRSIVTSQAHRISQAIIAEPLILDQEIKSRLMLRAGSALFPDDGSSVSALVQSARVVLGRETPSMELRIRSH